MTYEFERSVWHESVEGQAVSELDGTECRCRPLGTAPAMHTLKLYRLARQPPALPAAATHAHLVLDLGDGALLPPVNRLGQCGGVQIAVLEAGHQRAVGLARKARRAEAEAREVLLMAQVREAVEADLGAGARGGRLG